MFDKLPAQVSVYEVGPRDGLQNEARVLPLEAKLQLIEALAAGKPIVATDIEGNREIVDEGKTGLIVPPGDSKALASAIVSLARGPVRAKELGQAARVAAFERFSEQRMVQQVLDAYDRLTIGASQRATPRAVLDNSARVEQL